MIIVKFLSTSGNDGERKLQEQLTEWHGQVFFESGEKLKRVIRIKLVRIFLKKPRISSLP